MTENPLSLTDLRLLGELDDAVIHNRHVRWAATGRLDRGIVTGTMRGWVDMNNILIDNRRDVRDSYMWISGGFEYTIPVKDILKWMKEGLFVVSES